MSIARTSQDTFTLGINTGVLWEYGLEASDDLLLPWTPLNTEFLAGDGGRHSLRVILPPGAPWAFFRYRIRERALGASGDALADWDRIHFFNASVLVDVDGDGFADALESALGTNQNDALSYPWRVVRTVPYAGEEGHARDAAVLLYLNQPLPLSVAEVPANFVRELHFIGGEGGVLDFALNASGSTVILPGRKVVAFLPSPPLLQGSNHTLLDNYRVDFSTATTGLAQLAPWHAVFSTVDRLDTVGPWVKQVLPGETAIEVARDFVPSIEWSQPLQPASLAAANVTVVNETNGLPHAVNVVFDYDTNRMSLTHAAPFDADTVYKVTLGAGFSNLMAKPLLHPFAWSFRTRPDLALPVAGQGPSVAAISPAPYSVDAGVGPIAITFSEPMDEATMGAATVHLRAYGTASDVEGTFSYDTATQILSFTPLADLNYSTRYELTLDAPAILSTATPPQPLQAQASFIFTTAPAPGSGTPGTTADANAGTPDPDQKPPLQLAISYGDPTGHASATVRLEMTLPDGSLRAAQLPNATKQWRTELSPKVPDGTTVVVVPSFVRDDDHEYYTYASPPPESATVEVGAASPATAGTGYTVTNSSYGLLGALLAGPFIAQIGGGETITVAPAATDALVKMELRANGKIEPAPENSSYEMCKLVAGGIDDLGPLPMGKGRQDFPDKAYTAPIQIIGTVPALANVQWQWKRTITFRSWYIRQNAQGNGWTVSVRRPKIGPRSDKATTNFEDFTPSAAGKIYIYDNSALGPADGPPNSTAVGDFVYEKKQFMYEIENNAGGNWTVLGKLDVGQKLIAKRIALTGTVATDFQGIENSNQERVLDLTITEAEVRAIVGGTLQITIEPTAQ